MTCKKRPNDSSNVPSDDFYSFEETHNEVHTNNGDFLGCCRATVRKYPEATAKHKSTQLGCLENRHHGSALTNSSSCDRCILNRYNLNPSCTISVLLKMNCGSFAISDYEILSA